jgi:hypothetical protein
MTLKNIFKKISPELVLSGLAALVVWIVLAMMGSGPAYSDELLYVDIGLNNYQVASYANRYFHVYLQKLFMSLAPTPLAGTKIFWGFLVSATALLVYWNARSFFQHSRPLHGLLAVGFYFSFHFISRYCGVTSADITAMWMVTIFLTVYLFHLRSKRIHRWPLVALGALSFLSFKTKETTLFANLFLLGLLFDQDGRFDLKEISNIIKPFLIGFLSAIGLLILLDAIFLHTPLFSISPSTFAAVFENYAYTGGFRKEPTSYFTTFLLADIMVPFLLFLVSGVIHYDKEEHPSLKLVWLFPLVLAFFMTLNMLKIPWGFIERFYFPALPVIAILAPQWLRFDPPRTAREKTIMAVLSLAAIGLVVFLYFSLQNYTASIQWDYGKFTESIYQPLLLCLLLGFILVVRRMNWLNVLLPLFCILALLLAPWAYNQKYIFRVPLARDYFNLIYAPFISYQAQIQPVEGLKFFVSSAIPSEYQMLTNDRNEISALFNIFFNARTSQKNFQIGFEPEKMGSTLAAGRFNYALLTQSDWERISKDPAVLAEIQAQYAIDLDPGGKLVLLDGK